MDMTVNQILITSPSDGNMKIIQGESERIKYSTVPEEAAGTLGVIELSDFHLRHDIMFLFPKNSNFRADYTAIFRELRACAEQSAPA